MKVYKEMSLTDFEPWSGAKDRYNVLTYEQLEQLTAILEDEYPDGMSETQVNDILWFEEDWIAEMLGFDDWDSLERHNNGDDEEDEDEEEDDNDE